VLIARVVQACVSQESTRDAIGYRRYKPRTMTPKGWRRLVATAQGRNHTRSDGLDRGYPW
jgi:hypothetical protein